MKAITLYQPWASLLVKGAKMIETRSWDAGIRIKLPQRVAIHAGKTWSRGQRNLSLTGEFARALAVPDSELVLGVPDPDELPLGAVVGLVTIVKCRRTGSWVEDLPRQERTFGDFSPGRWGWFCEDPVALDSPVSCTGHQGFFELPPEVARAIGGSIKVDQQSQSLMKFADLLAPGAVSVAAIGTVHPTRKEG